MLPTFQPRRPLHCHRARNDSPSTPPAAEVMVVAVKYRPLESNGLLWVFSGPVEDPAGDIGQLVVAGLPAEWWERADASSLVVWFAEPLAPGENWSNPAGAAGIVGTDGAPLAAGSGAVTGD